jgi:hypothetical protein
MSRKLYTSRNNISDIFTFQKSGSTSDFFVGVNVSDILKRVSFRFYNGIDITQTAGNNINYNGFFSDNSIRNLEIRTDSIENIISLDFFNNFNPGVLYGNLDLSPLINLYGIKVDNNPNLTGLTFASSNNYVNSISAFGCDLKGNLDLTAISGLSGGFYINNNFFLTGITHAPSNGAFISYGASLCGLVGNLDLTPLSGFGGVFQVNTNLSLTGITHSPSSNNFTVYEAQQCNLKGNLDLTPLSGLGGTFQVNTNSQLTGITHSNSTNNFILYNTSNCNLTGSLDLSPLLNLGGANSGITSSRLKLDTNTSLTNVILPNSNQFFKNAGNSEGFGAFALYQCNLDYVDFTKLSGATLLSGTTQGRPRISLRNNNMGAADVNHILVDFSGNATNNPTGWSNVNLNIAGTNVNPDSSSGGYNGLAAVSFLTGSPYNWTITY